MINPCLGNRKARNNQVIQNVKYENSYPHSQRNYSISFQETFVTVKHNLDMCSERIHHNEKKSTGEPGADCPPENYLI